MPTECLTAEEIQAALRSLPDWTYQENALVRNIRFPSFLTGIEFVNAVAHMAERHDHHPDIHIHYWDITLRYWTHTANGVTQKDVDGAKEVNQIYGQLKKLISSVMGKAD